MWYYKRSNPRLVLWLASLSIAVCFVWMYFSTIQMVVRAEGKVVPSGQNKVVQHLEGGIVSEILVSEGDAVEAGQVLFRIKNEFISANLRELRLSQQVLKARSFRLQSLLDGKETLQFPADFMDSSEIRRAEIQLFDDARNDFMSELEVLNSIFRRKQSQVKELVQQLQNLKKELQLAQRDVDINRQLLSKGAGSEKEVLDSQKRFQAIQTNLDSVQLSIPVARAEQQEVQSKLQKSRSNFQLELRKELNDASINLKKVESQIEATTDVKQRSEVVSSVNGIINKLYVNTIGGIIQPGDLLASITPVDDSLIIEARVKEADRGEIWLGQDARIKFRAYDFSRYGSLDGKINFISPDSSADNRIPNDYFYRVNIVVNQQKLADDKPILPGMLSDVDLLAESKSVLSIILGPIVKAWSVALTDQ